VYIVTHCVHCHILCTLSPYCVLVTHTMSHSVHCHILCALSHTVYNITHIVFFVASWTVTLEPSKSFVFTKGTAIVYPHSTRTHTYLHEHTYTHMRTHTCLHKCTHANTHTHTHTHTHTRTHTQVARVIYFVASWTILVEYLCKLFASNNMAKYLFWSISLIDAATIVSHRVYVRHSVYVSHSV